MPKNKRTYLSMWSMYNDHIIIMLYTEHICISSVKFTHSVISSLWDPTDCSTSGSPVQHPSPGACLNSCPWVGDTIQLSHPLLSPSPAISLSSESVLCIIWPKYWISSFSISLFNEYSGLISFIIDQFVLLAVQGTLKSLLQQHSSKATVPWASVSLWPSSHIHT